MPNPNHPPRPTRKRSATEMVATEAGKHTHALPTQEKKRIHWDNETLVRELRKAAKEGNFEEFNEIIVTLDPEIAYHALQEDKWQLYFSIVLGAYNSLKQDNYDEEGFIKAHHICKTIDSRAFGRICMMLTALFGYNDNKEDLTFKTISLDSDRAVHEYKRSTEVSCSISAVERLQGNHLQIKDLMI